MKRLIFAGFAAVLLATSTMVPPAEARCWWNGYSWHCWYPHAWYWRHYYRRPYAYWHHPYWHHPYAWRY